MHYSYDSRTYGTHKAIKLKMKEIKSTSQKLSFVVLYPTKTGNWYPLFESKVKARDIHGYLGSKGNPIGFEQA